MKPAAPRLHRHAGWQAVAGYGAALLIGVALAFRIFPHWALTGALPPGAPPRADFGKDIIGQLYFFSQPWHGWNPANLLLDRRLSPPWGASIALTDSMPLVTLLAKLLRPLLPPFDQTISIYQAAAWALQPVAAVFALRGAGEKRWLPAFAVAVIAASLPTFLFRLWHAALDGHFFILTMLGLYLRIVRGSDIALLCGCILQVALLLIHPYLMLIDSALLLAAPLTLLLRRDPRWRRAMPAVVLSSIAMLLLGEILGYWGAESDGGFGFYSMNLAAPFWPTFSALIPGVVFAPVDGTGGQADGYQYMGLGLIGLLAVSAAGWRIWRRAIRSHPGLALACLGLLALAVSNWVFLFHYRIVHIPFRSTLLSQMRGSGRLFWPVAYALLVGAAIVVLRRFPRAGGVLLLAASLVQFADARVLREMDHADLANPAPYPSDPQRLSAILRAHDRLTVLPSFPCNGGGTPANEDLLWIASRTRMAISSIYMARQVHPQDCIPVETMNTRPDPDEIRVILPGFEQAVAALPEAGNDCRTLAPYILCSRHRDLLAGLPVPVTRTVPVSTPLPLRAGEPGADTLLAGWTAPAPGGGVWSVSPDALLGARLATPAPAGAVLLRIRAAAMPEASRWGWSSRPRSVSVWAGTRRIADWTIGGSLGDFQAAIPADWIRQKGAAIVTLRTGPLVSMLDRGRTPDPRRFGIWLESVSFTPAAADSASR